jgi:hypothetical protein
VTWRFVCRNYEVKGGGDRVLLCVLFALMFLVLISSLFARDYPDSPLSVSVRVPNIVFDAICRYLTLFVNEVCLRLCCYAIMLHLKRIQCLRVAEKSKSAKDCERDLINKAQVSTLWLSRFVFSVFNIQPNHFIFLLRFRSAFLCPTTPVFPSLVLSPTFALVLPSHLHRFPPLLSLLSFPPPPLGSNNIICRDHPQTS